MREILLFVFTISTGLGLRAQELPRVRHFAPQTYGAQSQNWSLTQSTPQGWLYMGNNRGLLEFDGARWNTFYLPLKQTVRAVGNGPDNRIYCGGFAEFGYWQPDASGQLLYHSLSQSVQSDNLGKEEIWHILPAGNKVFFQSFSTIYCYENDRIAVLKPPGAIMFVQMLGERLVFQVIGKGLYELMPDHSFRYLEGTAPIADQIVQFLLPDTGISCWIGTAKDGIWHYDGQQVRAWNDPMNALFKRNQLNKALVMTDGRWAIGTILDGLYVLGPDRRVQMHLNRENGLQNNTVLALYEDRDHNLWAGLDRGIDFIELNSPLRFYNDQSGRTGTVYSAARYQGNMYLGTNQGVFLKQEGALEANFQLLEGTQGQVWDLQVFDGQLMCGHNDGTFVIDGRQARALSNITGGWYFQRVPGRSDALLQSTYTGLVVFLKDAAGNWRFSHKIDGFTAPLRKIMFDQHGNLWGIHPNKGLFRMRLSDDLLHIYEQRAFTRADGLPSDQGLDLVQLSGHLYITFDADLRQVTYRGDQPVFEPTNSLPGAGKLLAGKGDAYFRAAQPGTLLWYQPGKAPVVLPLDLIPGYERIVDLPEDAYLFCQENGYALLQQNGATGNVAGATPRACVRRIWSGNMSFSQTNSPLVLPYRNNTLRFEFAVDGFGHTPRFSWRLEGFQKDWSDWTEVPEKEYTNLPPGQYTFHVRSDYSLEESTLVLEILPPWYRSGWAYLAYGLLAMALLYVTEKYNQHRLSKQRQHLQAEKERELARQKDEAERELLSLELENKSRELSNAALSLIRKNEMLQKIREDLQVSKGDPRALSNLRRSIDGHLESDHDWEIFETSFNQVHDQFFKRLMLDYPELTPGDLRLAAYLKMNFSSKEIAPLFNISIRGVENKRYRLRKKLGLPEDANLTEFMINY